LVIHRGLINGDPFEKKVFFVQKKNPAHASKGRFIFSGFKTMDHVSYILIKTVAAEESHAPNGNS
jgi:hypothetical protein